VIISVLLILAAQALTSTPLLDPTEHHVAFASGNKLIVKEVGTDRVVGSVTNMGAKPILWDVEGKRLFYTSGSGTKWIFWNLTSGKTYPLQVGGPYPRCILGDKILSTTTDTDPKIMLVDPKTAASKEVSTAQGICILKGLSGRFLPEWSIVEDIRRSQDGSLVAISVQWRRTTKEGRAVGLFTWNGKSLVLAGAFECLGFVLATEGEGAAFLAKTPLKDGISNEDRDLMVYPTGSSARRVASGLRSQTAAMIWSDEGRWIAVQDEGSSWTVVSVDDGSRKSYMLSGPVVGFSAREGTFEFRSFEFDTALHRGRIVRMRANLN